MKVEEQSFTGAAKPDLGLWVSDQKQIGLVI